MQNQLQHKMDQIKEELQVDFAALALSTVDKQTKIREISWQYVSGNTNQNYKHIRLQVGKGIGGIVWRTGRGFSASNLQKQPAKLVELPITRMERLETVSAYPVLDMGEVKGVLLTGFRSVTEISELFLTNLEREANELIGYL